MIPDAGQSSRGLEYFCSEGDELWTADDASLIELGKKELYALRLGEPSDVFDAFVVRMPKCYPVYDAHYRANLETIRTYLAEFENLPYEQIAQIEGVRIGTVKSRINRAKHRLRSALEGAGGDIK